MFGDRVVTFAAALYPLRTPGGGGGLAVAPNQVVAAPDTVLVVDSADSSAQTIPIVGTVGDVGGFTIELTPSGAFGIKVIDVSAVTFLAPSIGTVQMGPFGPGPALPGFSQPGVAGWVVWWDGGSFAGALPLFFG